MQPMRFWEPDMWNAYVAACRIERRHAKPSPPATDKQRELMVKLGTPAFVAEDLTKAEASVVIAWMLADQRRYHEQRRAREARRLGSVSR